VSPPPQKASVIPQKGVNQNSILQPPKHKNGETKFWSTELRRKTEKKCSAKRRTTAGGTKSPVREKEHTHQCGEKHTNAYFGGVTNIMVKEERREKQGKHKTKKNGLVQENQFVQKDLPG